MSDIFQIARVGMLEGSQRLEAISSNAASAALAGYRRHVVGRAFDAALTAALPVNADSDVVLPQHVDVRPGAMIATGRALDIAIDSDDLFFALTDGTQTWLTRAGAFRVNEAGLLVGEQGLRVVGTQGDVHLPSSEVEVAPDGRMIHQGVIVGALQLFRVNDPASLRADRGALLMPSADVQPAEIGVGRVRGGTLEASNTDATREMLDLVALSRQFEALNHVVQGYDELLGRAIERLSEG